MNESTGGPDTGPPDASEPAVMDATQRWLGWRTRVRPFPALTSALGAAGGLLVIIGVIALGGDQAVDDGSGTAGAAFCALAILVALVAMIVGTEPIRAGAVAVAVIAVPAFWVFLLAVDADSDPTTAIEILTLVSWAVLFFVPPTKGRVVFLAVTVALFWFFVVDQVADDNSTQIEFDSAQVSTIPVGINSSDEYGDDPQLDRLWDDCDDGDLEACDDLYFASPIGSQYEEFAETCGGQEPDGFGGECAVGGFGDGPDSFDEPPFPPEGDVVDEDFPFFPEDAPGFDGTPDDPDRPTGVISMVIGLAYLAAAWGLDRKRLAGAATPFLVVGAVALAVGSIIVVSDIVWLVGVFLVATGKLTIWIAAQARRRGSAWLGLLLVVAGVLTFAADLFDDSVTGFGLLTLGLGVLIVAASAVAAASPVLRGEPLTDDEVLEFTETGTVEHPEPEPPVEPPPPAVPPPATPRT